MKLEWLPMALMNRRSQLAYIAERNPWAAIDMGEIIETAVQRLTEHPHVGRPGRHKGTRELVVVGTPFVIAYRIEPEKVVILRLVHGAQRWPRRL
ncbi:type II toxin-antitoxin system RelE/ParE family toxin [Inquilinus limosus]|uniref:Addiction module toxin RelE n=1 Tax=Inquilinus limosus TaxID=171674 RepID=A0A211Z9P9_9PROT|nr:type II toxin-antitoxin system RelE/ParE family toxin [Inquilinus limosus]OWJ61991.1 addiction module toxin RelE [Inquilinus limosus]